MYKLASVAKAANLYKNINVLNAVIQRNNQTKALNIETVKCNWTKRQETVKMNKLNLILSGLFICLNIFGSDNEFFKPRSILVQELSNEKFIYIPQQYRINNNHAIEVLDLNETETLSSYTFGELIEQSSFYGPYMIARVTSQNFVHYYDAVLFRDQLFKDINDESFQNKDSLNEYLSKQKNPLNGLPITNVQFFVVHNLYQTNFQYCYNLYDLYVHKTIEEKRNIIKQDIHPTFKAVMQISLSIDLDDSKNYKEAKSLYEDAINNPYTLAKHKAFAQFQLGVIHYKYKKYTDAKKLFDEVVENPYTVDDHKIAAQFYLGKIYFYGWGISKDISYAKNLFTAAASISSKIVVTEIFYKRSIKYIDQINKILKINPEQTSKEILNIVNKRYDANFESLNQLNMMA